MMRNDSRAGGRYLTIFCDIYIAVRKIFPMRVVYIGRRENRKNMCVMEHFWRRAANGGEHASGPLLIRGVSVPVLA